MLISSGDQSASVVNTGRDCKVILIPVQIAAWATMMSYFVYRAIELRLRNVLNRLSPLWMGNDRPLPPHHPELLFRDAGVLIEIADCAERHANGPDADLIGALRQDALRIRLAAF